MEIAIIEDNQDAADTLEQYLRRFSAECHTAFQITTFHNAVSFLENYTASYDIIFMDIAMPYLNGMDAAHRLRELDSDVLLIFVTSLAQYAVDGYEVDAFTYFVKPISYSDFALRFTRAYRHRLLTVNNGHQLILNKKSGSIRLSSDEIAYCEVSGHKTTIHSLRGDFSQHTTLSAIENKLDDPRFCRCNHCYLINLQYVKSVMGDELELCYANTCCTLKISRSKRKIFLDALQKIWGTAVP